MFIIWSAFSFKATGAMRAVATPYEETQTNQSCFVTILALFCIPKWISILDHLVVATVVS